MNTSTAIRNEKIYEEYLTGTKMIDIAGKFSMALASVQKIIRERRGESNGFSYKVAPQSNKQCLTLQDMKNELNLHIGQKLNINGTRYTIENF